MSSTSTIPATTAPPHAEKVFIREAGLVGVGGAVGALARGAVASMAPSLGWPELAATQAVNLAGAVALGALVGVLEIRGPRSRWRAFLGVGVLGSFTTFSALIGESRDVATSTSPGVAFAFLTGSLALGVAAFWLGEHASQRVLSRPTSVHDAAEHTP
jgi:CrcB protein